MYPEELVGMQAIFSRTNRRLSIARQQRSSDIGDAGMRSMSEEEAVALPTLQRPPTATDSPRRDRDRRLQNVKETEASELLSRFQLPNVPRRSGSSESEV